MSDALGRTIRLRITAATLRSVEHNGGLDKFLLTQSNKCITEKAQRIKRQIEKKLAA